MHQHFQKIQLTNNLMKYKKIWFSFEKYTDSLLLYIASLNK